MPRLSQVENIEKKVGLHRFCEFMSLSNLLIAVLMGTILLNCAVTSEQLKEKKPEALINTHIESQSFNTREAIILELESRKDVHSLNRCLEQITAFRTITIKWPNGGLDDSLVIVESMGRLRNTEASAALLYAIRRLDMKELKLQVLDTCRKIGSSSVTPVITYLLKDQDAEIRWQALDVLGYLKLSEARPAIYLLLSDTNANVRMNAAHVLGSLGHTEDSPRISFLLMDSDIAVRIAAENSLRMLNVTEKKIEEWKNKAHNLTLDSAYSLHPSQDLKTTESKVGDQFGHLGNYHALIVGNNAYANLPKLQTAVNDAQAIADLLEKLYGFKVTLILNGTRRVIVSALDRYREMLTATDNLLVYYAGHGHFDKGAERGYWLPVEASFETSADWISNVDITDKLKAIEAKHVMVIADSCYSGTLTRGIHIVDSSSDYINQIAQKRARTVLTSGGNEPVLDSGGGNHSVFAKALLNALTENQNIIDGTQLFSRIRRPVMVGAPQTPQYSDIRFAGHEGGDFLFVRQ